MTRLVSSSLVAIAPPVPVFFSASPRLRVSASSLPLLLFLLSAPLLGQPPDEAPPSQSDSLDDALLDGLDAVIDDPIDTDSDPASTGSPTDSPAADGADSLDQQLLEGLGEPEDDIPAEPEAAGPDGAAGPDSNNPLDQLGRRMRQVEALIARRNSDQATQDIQSRIVDDLSKLIDQLAQQQQQQQQQSSSSQSQSGGQQPQAGQQRRNQPADRPARNSSQRLRSDKLRKPDAEQIANLLKDVWGHLPDRQRQQMEQYHVEEFLPKYELEIEQYFKALADGLDSDN